MTLERHVGGTTTSSPGKTGGAATSGPQGARGTTGIFVAPPEPGWKGRFLPSADASMWRVVADVMQMAKAQVLRYTPYCGTKRLDWFQPLAQQQVTRGDTIRLKAAPLRGGVNLTSQERQSFAALVNRCLEKGGLPQGRSQPKSTRLSPRLPTPGRSRMSCLALISGRP